MDAKWLVPHSRVAVENPEGYLSCRGARSREVSQFHAGFPQPRAPVAGRRAHIISG